MLDFGLARPVDAEVELAKSGAVVGTPAVTSPEQARGEKVDHRTDLFSLGAVLYRLVTGRLPFQGPNTMAVLMALGTQDPPPVRDLNPAAPEPLAERIHRLLAKTPDARPATADEVVKRLRAMGQARPTSAASQVVYVPIRVTAVPEANPFAEPDATEVESVPAAAPVKPRRSWAVVAGLAALMFVVFGGVIIIIRNRDGSETKIEVPPDATVTLKDKTGKTLATVGPKTTPQVADDGPDRKAAEWVLSAGGSVRINPGEREINSDAELPGEKVVLVWMRLAGKQVRDADLARLQDCRELTHVDLRSSGVTDAGVAHLKNLRSLTVLDLEDTGVTSRGLEHVQELAGLQVLWLHGTAAPDTGLPAVKGFPSLARLGLDGTKVTNAGVARLAGHQTLSSLSLTNTPFTDAGLAHLRTCKALAVLDLRRTSVTAKGLADFHAAVPGCKITHDGGVIEPRK